jgi:hypothetical protein
MRIATVCAAIALVLGSALATAAELRGDAIFLCDNLRQPSPALRPIEVRRQLAPLLNREEFQAAYAKLADIAAAALGKAAGAERFLTLLRNPPPGRSFDVAPDGNTEKIFRAAPADTLTIDCAAAIPQHLIDLSAAALIAESIRVKEELPAMLRRKERLAQASQDAEDLLKNGLAMWPWELWLNGLRLSKKDSDPLFRTQWVFMRPTAGIEIDTYRQASADLQASVALEPLGFVRYRGEGYSHWWGASVVITASTSRGAGYGGLFRWDNYVIGVTRHKGQGSQPNSNFLLIGVDLYDLLNKKRTELKEWDGFAALLK